MSWIVNLQCLQKDHVRFLRHFVPVAKKNDIVAFQNATKDSSESNGQYFNTGQSYIKTLT